MREIEVIHTTRYRWWRVDGKLLQPTAVEQLELIAAAEKEIATRLENEDYHGNLEATVNNVEYAGVWAYGERIRKHHAEIEDSDRHQERLNSYYGKINSPSGPRSSED
jgi:transcriptional regulator with AAA-type ATPase domain